MRNEHGAAESRVLTRLRRGAALGVNARVAMMLLGALMVRLVAMSGQGHEGDISALARWAESVAARGLGGYYEAGGDSNYLAVLYLLWPLGLMFDRPELFAAVRAISIPFDLLTGAMLFVAGRSLAGPQGGLLAAALYLFNPAVVLAGAVWGQLDAVGTAAVVGSLIAVASGRYVTAGMLSVLAVLVKPQFAIAGAVILGMLLLRRKGGGRASGVALAIVGGVAAYLAVTVPLGLEPAELLAIVGDSAAQLSFASLHGFNAWGLIFGFETSDGPWVYLGLALLAAGVLGALALLHLRRDLAGVFGVAFLIALAVYFLPTRVHERYLFPAIALLAPLVALRPTLLRPFVALSGVFSLSLLYVLIRGRRSGAIDVPLRIERLLDWPGVPLIAVALMAAAAWCVVQLWRFFREEGRAAPLS